MDLKRIASYRGGYPFAVLATCAAVGLLVPLRAVLATPVVMLLLVPVIILIARVSGVRPSAMAAVLAFLLLDFLFIPPYYRLTVAELPEWIGLLVFLIVALVSGQQTGQLRQRELAAMRRQRELELLNRLSFSIASEKSADATAELVVTQVAEVLGARRAALYVGGIGAGRAGRCLASAGAATPSSGEEALVAWVLRTSKAHRHARERRGALGPAARLRWSERRDSRRDRRRHLPAAADLDEPGGRARGRACAQPGPPSDDDVRLLAAVANLAASSIERQRLEEDAAHAEALREADRLKSTLVSSVSHELKTPLAAATARVTGLVEEGTGCDADAGAGGTRSGRRGSGASQRLHRRPARLLSAGVRRVAAAFRALRPAGHSRHRALSVVDRAA